ncbi:transposase [Paraburkholderia sp. Ac-20340]|uniref:transposase n=1 Tax=Paraburkholderia sp. Ac-20340 TaxID=2703888 RepID=UPI00197F0338|nr:transposase [Paraburkholderia sp. Ac-20340]MBN3858596.1 transposase [Paraburkholderia sp. Ac-20340]
MPATTYGLHISKRVFQIYWADAENSDGANRRFSRADLMTFLSQRPAGRIALEACANADWWGRRLRTLGHEVVLLRCEFIHALVDLNGTGAATARAIWTAAQQPGKNTVAAMTEDQQAILGLNRMRSSLVKFRAMQINRKRSIDHAPQRLGWQAAPTA